MILNEKKNNLSTFLETPTEFSGNVCIIDEVDFEIIGEAVGPKKDTDVDGEIILAKIRGQFFVPDGVSRNERFYPKELWENVINDPIIQKRIENRLMFGTIGHDGVLGDKGLREGNAALIVTKIWIDEEGRGMGEALVLATPVGKILNVLIRAKCKLSVSSRANGTYEGEIKIQGYSRPLPIVSARTYELDGWDVVVDPGFLEAKPELVESVNKLKKILNSESIEDSKTKSEGSMNEKLIAKICETNDSLKEQLATALDANKALTADINALREENENANAQLSELSESKKELLAFGKLGTVAEITEKLAELKVAQESIANILVHGESVEEIIEALVNTANLVSWIEENCGSLKGMKDAIADHKVLEAKIKELSGDTGIDGIEEALKRFETIIDENNQKAESEKIKTLSKELKISEAQIKKLLDKGLSEEEIKELHGKVAESVSSDAHKYRKITEEEEKDKKDTDEEEEEGDDSKKSDKEDELEEKYTSKVLNRTAKKYESKSLKNDSSVGLSILNSLK